MNTKFASTFALASIFALAVPALAQTYHMEYGGSRVVQQNQTGLYMPSSTYIGAGTLSRSAQGKKAGVGSSLPAVNMGSTVRTPGDNMYNNDGTDRQANGAFIYQDTERAIIIDQARSQQLARQRQLMLERRRSQGPQGHLYVPGSNTGTATYGTVPTGGLLYRGNGTATYGENLKNPNATRSF